ncbi:hypothetical protein KDN24_15565 [Bacillus sp. Bva_UNVM-123]|uniref:hypothetical protein n=1 Tax=Bacillus sp. Bva_UNVM-123 TaxID=2829798 RepID=UPI00391F96D9
MKSKVNLVILLISVLFVVFGCSKSDESVETEIYNGKSLLIGIIGEVPKIREDNIKFTNIDFNDLQNVDNFSNIDAVFITKENLKEAEKPKYASIYNSSHIPFLFIETPKSYVPYVHDNIDFEDYPDDESGMYAYLYDSDSERHWGYGLYNDKVNEQNIQDVYSRVFKTIEEISNN